MSWRMARNSILAICAAGAAMVMSGCGSSSANVVTVSVSPGALTVVAGQVANFTATVGGSTTLTVAWTCTYLFTPLPTTANPNPTQIPKPLPCTSGASVNGGSIGTWTTSSTNGSNVLTYTAPSLSNFQNPPPLNAQFRLVQFDSASSNLLDRSPNPLSDSCDPTCGTIDNNGVYTAPATVPTDTKPPQTSKSTAPTTVFVVISSSSDPGHFFVATITLINATTNPVTFSSLYPSTVAAGGVLQDVFLKASNLLNTSQVSFIPPTSLANLVNAQPTVLNNTTQVFTIPISSAYCAPSAANVTPVVSCDASIMTRVRLLSQQLAQAEPDSTQPAWIVVANLPGNPTPASPCVLFPGTTSSIACPLHIVNAGPAVVGAAPDSFPQGTTQNGSIEGTLDGGYYGASSNAVNVTFAGTGLTKSAQSGARRIIFSQNNFQLPSPGLYEATITSNTTQGAPPTFPTATTNIAVQPAFSVAPVPTSIPLSTAGLSVTNLAPSAIALNSIAGYVVIVEQATSTLQFVNLAGTLPALNGNPVPLGGTASSPTDIAIDTQEQGINGDLGIVVSSGDSQLYFYSLNGTAGTATPLQTPSLSVDLRTLLGQPTATG